MKKLFIILILLLPTIASAQQQKPTLQKEVEATLGSTVVENLALKLKVEDLAKQIEDLKKQLEDKEKK